MAENQEDSWMTDGESSTTTEKFPLFVMNPGIITMTPQTLGTSEISKLHEQNDVLIEQELTNAFEFQDLIMDQRNTVPLYPLLLTVTGLPKSGKTMSITNAFRLEVAQETSRFSHYELVASGFKRGKKIQSANVTRDHSFKMAMQGGLTCNFKTAAFDQHAENNSTFEDSSLRYHTSELANYLQERQKQRFAERKVAVQSPDLHTKSNSSQYLEASLRYGIGLINMWDVSINKSIRPFLETLGSCFTRNRMWVFIDLERDLPKLYLPIDEGEDHYNKLQWRSRIQYLLRMCQMCKHVRSKVGFKKSCTIFAAHRGSNGHNIESEIQSLCSEIQNAAGQMGVEDLIDFEIKSLNLDQHKMKPLRKTFKTILQNLEQEEIPLSWVFLRSSLANHSKFFIKHEELLVKAKQCNIAPNSLEDFCKFFTSYGSIFDVRMISDSSDYVVVKPLEFLSCLDTLFQETTTQDGVMSVDTEDNAVIMQILSSVSLALPLPYGTDLSTTTLPNHYYFPSAQTRKVNLSFTPGAVQLVLSMQSPRINLQLEVTKQLCESGNGMLNLKATEYVNSIVVKMTGEVSAGIVLTFQGDVTEITLQDIEHDITDDKLEKICYTIIEAVEVMFTKKARLLSGIRYHFAIRCEQDALDQSVAFNAYRKRHILPNHALCDDCKANYLNKSIIKAWNSALEKRPIPRTMKLNGDLSAEDVTMLASEITEYPWEAICMFARALNVKTYLTEPKKKKIWLVLGMLMEWEEKRREDDEPPKKVLASKMITLDDIWKGEKRQVGAGKEPDFKKLARKLDIQVLALDQMKIVKEQFEKSKTKGK